MAYSLLTHTVAGSTDQSNVTTSAIDTSGANFIIVAMADYTANPSGAPTDNKSNTLTPRTKYSVTSSCSVTIYYITNPTVGSGHTFTAHSSGSSYMSLAVASFSGAVTSTPYDVENGSSASSVGSIQPGSITPTQNNELIISALASDAVAITESINSSFSITDNTDYTGSQHFGIALAYLIQTGAAAVNPTWSWTGSPNVAVAIASFKAPLVASPRRNLLGTGI